MKKNILFLFLYIFTFLITACGSTPQGAVIPVSKPDWVWKPSQNNKIAGVGISKEHIRGASAQRELAISRAIDVIAMQLGVQVENITTIQTKASSSGSSSSAIDSYSIHTVNGGTVNAVVKEFWTDPQTNELYVWMVLE